jgi:uncharacterized membrane protein YbaN (DUF454 family)
MFHDVRIPTSSSTPIRVNSLPGNVSVEAPCLFADGGDSAIHAFIERVFDVPAVRAVALDRRRATIRIEFDRKALDPRAALRAFATALENDRSAPHGDSPSRFAGLSGRIRRVERRSVHGRDFTVAFVESDVMEDFQRQLAPLKLHEVLRDTRLFGPMVHDWQERGHLRWSTRLRTALLTMVMTGVTVVVVVATLPVLIVLAVAGSIVVLRGSTLSATRPMPSFA